jgi:hypothetical protein
MKNTNNGNVIYARTDDYCAIWTTNILETISKMTSNGWTLIEQIDDNNSVILFFWKWDLLSKLEQWNK